MTVINAIERAKERVNAVYLKCEEKGATLPEKLNLENLPACLDTIKNESQKVFAYYNGTDIANGKKVLLTKVGYQATGSETFSPNVRPYLISEDGWIMSGTYRYDIVSGVVDETTKSTVTGSSASNTTYVPYFMNNGKVVSFSNAPNMNVLSYRGLINFCSYEKGLSAGLYKQYSWHFLLDFGFFQEYNPNLYVLNDDITLTEFNLSSIAGVGAYNDKFIGGDRDLFYLAVAEDSSLWAIYKFFKSGDTYASTKITAHSKESVPSTIQRHDLFVACKGSLKTETGYAFISLSHSNYYCFDINETDETQSTFKIYSFPQNIVNELGNRTVEKIQTFYDGTFSLDLSDGTTFICRFTDKEHIEVLEIIEPFIVDGDETIYHRVFSETRMYWYQIGSKEAPISSNPYGPYNATKATVDWLAVPREQNRWNTTVLTGFLTGKTETEDGRTLVEVKTALPDEAE